MIAAVVLMLPAVFCAWLTHKWMQEIMEAHR